jgi:hypothetical protein
MYNVDLLQILYIILSSDLAVHWYTVECVYIFLPINHYKCNSTSFAMLNLYKRCIQLKI